MKKELFWTGALVLLAGVISLSLLVRAQDTSKVEKFQVSEQQVSGPFSHANLTIFLIHGRNQIEGNNFLTLQEALEQKRVIVHETKTVSELAIENLSDKDVYVQAGDIVKGGQQDRMLAVDLIVPPRSGKVSIAAFCVERGRWSQRGNESVSTFSGATEAAATKDLRLAAKRAQSQGEVWKNVSVAQEKLSENVGVRVQSSDSESSLQLSVENQKVRETVESYVKALLPIIKGKRNVIGYAFAINGKINSADLYASNALFTKLWPKLLRANAVEAIADLQQAKEKGPVTKGMIRSFLDEAEKESKVSEKGVTSRVRLMTNESEEHIFFETRDQSRNGAWVHRNYIRK